MSYYVGAERRNPVQLEKAWERRVDKEEAAAAYAAEVQPASSLFGDHSRPITSLPPDSGGYCNQHLGAIRAITPRRGLASGGSRLLSARSSQASSVVSRPGTIGTGAHKRLGTASSQASAYSVGSQAPSFVSRLGLEIDQAPMSDRKKLGTASSRSSAYHTELSAGTCRSTVLSLELEIERERREKAEAELRELKSQLAGPGSQRRNGKRPLAATRQLVR